MSDTGTKQGDRLAQRRGFLKFGCAAAAVAAVGARAVPARAQGAPLSETDPTAQALGYHVDATKVDRSKFPKYAPGDHCAACQLFQGKPGEAMGPCSVFPGKLVHAKGWCNAYVKRA